jgi:hypothetical protein
MPQYPTRAVTIPLTPAEERALIQWAEAHERTPVGQLRWLLRDILSPARPTSDDRVERTAA